MLDLQNVTKTFGNVKALDDLTMTVPRGAVYGLVGPNGAGKSTAIRCLLGVYRPDCGTVTLDGAPVYENPVAKARIGSIPDDIFYFPSATMEDMRKFYQGIYPKFDQALYYKLFEAFDLPKKAPLRRFSKGMQKQAAFHLTLCTRPEVLVLDEPVDGLDPVMRRQVWSLILSEVAKEETTVLISSHNLRELEDICDHVGIMHKGSMMLERSLSALQDNMVKVQLVTELPLPEQLDVVHHSTVGRVQTIIARGGADEVQQLLSQCHPLLCDVLPLSLEEVFIYELGGVDYEVKNVLL